MMQHRQIVLASNNVGKLKELRDMLAPIGFDVRSQAEFNVPSVPEPHPTFIENALLKARHASTVTGLPTLADDSGICVNALGGAPGVLSARYAGEGATDADNNQKLLRDLQNHTDRSAYYYCVLVYMRHANDPQPLIVQGRWDGEIIDTAKGEGGFGYDPYFWLASMQKTAAQLTPSEKNNISHRGQAMRMLIKTLQ